MSIKKKSVENLRCRGESYKDGMLLLIDHLTEIDWKVGTKFSARLNLIKKNIEAIYIDYAERLDKDASFSSCKKHFDSLLGQYNDILLQHTTLKDSFKSLLLAERCLVWKKGRKSFETPVLVTDAENGCFHRYRFELIQRETPFFDEENSLKEYIKIHNTLVEPFWFQSLALWQQNFIKANWKDLCTKSIPSSLRSVPGIANMSRHDFSINSKETLTYFRHATPFPIDLLKHARADHEGIRITYLNLASQIRLSLEQQLKDLSVGETREAVILTQSLLSPGTAATLKSQHISGSSDNDTKIYEMKEKAVKCFQVALNNPTERKNEIFLKQWGFVVQSNGSLQYKGHSFNKITLLSTNHPLNIWRRFSVHPQQVKHNDSNTALLLGAVRRYLLQKISEKDDLLIKLNDCADKESISSDEKDELIKILKLRLSDEGKAEFDKNTLRLFDAIQALLSIPSGQGGVGIFGMNDKHHRQSLMAAMEVMIINCIGATCWVACKSGKDRTGGASAAYDAAATFYELRGRFPRYDDTNADRLVYLKIYERLFASGHHQKVASQNAMGAEGLVRPKLYFPDDIKLDKQQVQTETELSRINKPKLARKKAPAIFHDQILEEELKSFRYAVEKRTMGDPSTLQDWGMRNWGTLFISGKSIGELRNGKEFESEVDFKDFIEAKLLYKIQNEDLKKYYSALCLYALHQGGFLNVFNNMAIKFHENPDVKRKVCFGGVERKINIIPLENGIQTEEIITYREKFIKKMGGDIERVVSEKGGYHYQAHSCYSVTLSPDKDRGYKLESTVNHVVVDCKAEELKPYFFKKTGLLGVLVGFFEWVKRFFKSLVAAKAAKERFLDKNWLNSLKKKVDKPKRITENVAGSELEQGSLNLDGGLNTIIKLEAGNNASEPVSPQQGVVLLITPGSESKQPVSQSALKSEISLLASQGLFKQPANGDDCQSQVEVSNSPCLGSVEGF